MRIAYFCSANMYRKLYKYCILRYYWHLVLKTNELSLSRAVVRLCNRKRSNILADWAKNPDKPLIFKNPPGQRCKKRTCPGKPGRMVTLISWHFHNSHDLAQKTPANAMPTFIWHSTIHFVQFPPTASNQQTQLPRSEYCDFRDFCCCIFHALYCIFYIKERLSSDTSRISNLILKKFSYSTGINITDHSINSW